ncbi:MAG: uroporphyrinogen decarboxylase family protein [Planctomycetota bacterium]
MTSRERMRAVMAGEQPDRTPFFPCIYIDHAAHSIGHRFEEALVDPRLGLQWMLQAHRLYQSDVVRVLLTPPRSWFRDKEIKRRGERLVQIDRRSAQVDGWFDVEGGGTLIPAEPPEPVRTLGQAEAIPFPSAEELLQTGRLDAAREVTERAHEEGLFVVGMAGGQTLNFLSSHVGDARNALVMMVDAPELVRRIFDKGTDASIEVGKAFARVGVDCLYIGDSWASGSVISPRMYSEYCTPCYRRAADEARARGLSVYKHCCGNYNPLLEAVKQDHLDGIEGLDPTSGMSVARTREALGDELCLIGGVSCLTLLKGTPDEVYAEARSCIRDGGPRYVLGSGCAVPRFTPIENMHAFARAALETAS